MSTAAALRVAQSRTAFKPRTPGLDDERLDVVYADAFDFLAGDKSFYDAVVLDLTDPIGECAKLFTAEFFKMVANRLSKNGSMSVHASFPICWPDTSRKIIAALNECFASVLPFTQYVPSYSDLMAFALCSKSHSKVPDIPTIAGRISGRDLYDLDLITPETYHAMFVLPPVIKRVLVSE